MTPNPTRFARPLRVAVVTETYPPEVNGVARTVACVANGLWERGHDIQLVRPRQDAADREVGRGRFRQVLTRGVPIPRYPGLKAGLPASGRLTRLWRESRPDVVHVATEGPLGWTAMQAARRLQIPVVSEFRTNFHAYSRHYGIGCLQGLIRRYLRMFHNRTHCTMVPTARLAGDLASWGFRGLNVVARGVDTRLYDPARRDESLRRAWGASRDTLVALGVGRIAPEKNLGVLQSAFEAMRAANPDTKLVMVGDGPARASMQANCPGAIFAGMRSGEDLAAHYASADLLLFPSVTETFGNVTTEAMASGLGVLAYDYAAAGELIRHGVSGWLAPFDDTAAYLELAGAVSRDVGGVRRVGSGARVAVGQMGWDRIVAGIETHYLAAMAAMRDRRAAAREPAEPAEGVQLVEDGSLARANPG